MRMWYANQKTLDLMPLTQRFDSMTGLYEKHTIEILNKTKNDLAIRIDDLKERLDNTQEKIERKESMICHL